MPEARPDPPRADPPSLIEGAKERSPSAWAQIYDTHYQRLYRYCYARTGNPSSAADLTSKVFLEALESIAGYQDRGKPLLAWLYRIARNVVVDHLRRNGREKRALERAGGGMNGHEPDPAAQVHDQEDLRGAIAKLTDDQQQVVLLRYYADFTTAEIADALDRSHQAVYSLEVRALAALRRELEAAATEARVSRWVAATRRNRASPGDRQGER